MEFEGKIVKVLPIVSGTSARGTDWRKQEFVFEYQEKPDDRYSDRVVLSIHGDKIDEYAIKEGDRALIGFGHMVNEWQGKYYNELRVYRFVKLSIVGTPNEQNVVISEEQREAMNKAAELFNQQNEGKEGESELPF